MSAKITLVSGRAFYLPGRSINTDRIIPARFLKPKDPSTFDGLGENVFVDDRAKLAGKHPFDLQENQGSRILVVDGDFGSGSSREHAVPALTQWGIQAIIGLSFAEIFSGNAVGNGLVCVEVKKGDHDNLIEALAHGGVGLQEVRIDLEAMQIALIPSSVDDVIRMKCSMPDSDRLMLVDGTWDQLPTALEAGDLIEKTAAQLPYFGLTA